MSHLKRAKEKANDASAKHTEVGVGFASYYYCSSLQPALLTEPANRARDVQKYAQHVFPALKAVNSLGNIMDIFILNF